MKKNCMASCGFCTPGDEDDEVADNRTDGDSHGDEAGSSIVDSIADWLPWSGSSGEQKTFKPYEPGYVEIGLFACCLGCLAYALLVAC